jgi:hypothetical protein
MNEDDELGTPEGHEGSTDMNAQINHLIRSFTDNISALHWKISQHASQIDALVLKNAELESQAEALSQALESEMKHSEELEMAHGELRGPVKEGQPDAFLDVGTAGWPIVVPEQEDSAELLNGPFPEELSTTTPQT